MITYFDASSLVKYFIEEAGSPEVRQLVADSISVTSRLSAVDAIQLASFLAIRERTGKDVRFSAFDQRLIEVAEIATR